MKPEDPQDGGEVFVDVPALPAAPPPPDAGPLEARLKERLVRDYQFGDPGKMLFGACPRCGKKSLHAVAPHYLRVHCGRTGKCGFDALSAELYPDLFADWTARFPDAPADACLRYAWGIDPARVAGAYSVGSAWEPRYDRGTATLRFELAEGLAVEQFVDEVLVRNADGRAIRQSCRVHGELAGHWWAMPGQDLAAAEQAWIVRHIRDALSLCLAGVPAVATVQADNYPAEALTRLAAACGGRGRPDLVWALGPSHLYHLRQWLDRAKAEGWPCLAAVAPHGWNNLHQRAQLAESHRAEYLYRGALETAKGARAKGILMYLHDGQPSFPLDYNHALYWFALDLKDYAEAMETLKEDDDAKKKEEAVKQASTVTELVKCLPVPLYYQSRAATDEAWYFFRFEYPHGGAPTKSTFTPKQLVSNSDFTSRLAHIAPGSIWKGGPKQLQRLADDWVYNIKKVETVDFLGYSADHRAYVFKDYAFRDGKLCPLNDEDFFDLPGLSIKSLLNSETVHISLNPNPQEFRADWLHALWAAYGPKGFASLAWWLGSLLVQQVRKRHESYPFLELVGEPGSGKSTLLRFLWKLLGRAHEGFDGADSSVPGVSRVFNQVANLPVILLEGDRTQEKDGGRPRKGLDVESFKKLYNGEAYRTRGERTSGNETYAPPFRGALGISQNLDVVGSDAILERLIHVPFDCKGHTDATRIAAEDLEQIDIPEVSGFLVRALLAEQALLGEYLRLYGDHAETLRRDPDVKKARIVRNYAQMMALAGCLQTVLPEMPREYYDGARGFLLDMAVRQQKAINQDHPMVREFWENFWHVEDNADFPVLDHSADAGLIAVSLVQCEAVFAAHKLSTFPRTELMRALETSRHPKYKDHGVVVHSAINARRNKLVSAGSGEPLQPKSVKCWVFEK